jgi:hypothetical protein
LVQEDGYARVSAAHLGDSFPTFLHHSPVGDLLLGLAILITLGSMNGF